MERRFGSFGCVPLLWSVLAVGVLALPLLGCAANRAPAAASDGGALAATDLLRQAREFSGRGESHRAEQYFLAALEAGASAEETYPELIDACIRGGRLGSASVHVDKRLREHPSDVKLLRLSISLEEGLGHQRKALLRADELAESQVLSPEQELFLAGYFQRAGQTGRALGHFHAYLGRIPERERPAWVADAVSRLENSQLGPSASIGSSAVGEVSDE